MVVLQATLGIPKLPGLLFVGFRVWGFRVVRLFGLGVVSYDELQSRKMWGLGLGFRV